MRGFVDLRFLSLWLFDKFEMLFFRYFDCLSFLFLCTSTSAFSKSASVSSVCREILLIYFRFALSPFYSMDDKHAKIVLVSHVFVCMHFLRRSHENQNKREDMNLEP